MNFLKIAVRHIRGNRVYAGINILGLSLGLAVCLLAYLFVRHELSFDRHYAFAERIILVGQRNSGNTYSVRDNSSALVATRFPGAFGEVEDASRSTGFSTVKILASEALQESQEGLVFVDTRFLRIFDFTWLQGSPAALDVPNGIVLTETLARQYFSSVEAAYGAALHYGKERLPLQVTGIIADLPSSTHFDFKALIAMAVYDDQHPDSSLDFWNTSYSSYVLLREPVPLEPLLARFDAFANRELADFDVTVEFNATPLVQVHLSQRTTGLITDRVVRIRVAIAIAVGVLAIAVVNFVNLATAVSTRRVMEVGLYRAVGASRGHLARRFFGEALALTLLAAVLAVALVELLLPAVNSGNALTLGFSQLSVSDWLLLPLLVLVVGLVAGAYPAIVLAALKPTAALRGEGNKGRSGRWLRNGLVVFQFAVSILLLACTLVFMRQLDHVRNFDMGFDAERVLVATLPEEVPFDLGARWQQLKAALIADAGVIGLVHSMASPLLEGILLMSLQRLDAEAPDQFIAIPAEASYLQFYGAKLLAGNLLDEQVSAQPVDSAARFDDRIILNEAAVRVLQWMPEEAVGQYLESANDNRRLQVVGVVANLHSNARAEAVPSLYLRQADNRYNFTGVLNIRIAPEQVGTTLNHIDSVWQQFFPDHPIARRFLAERIEAQWQAELRQLRLFGYASGITIAIACFGLYGLAVFTTRQRAREIGIRKVNGGSTWDILRLLTGDFSKLVLLANILAWPLVWVVMQRWLENFAYHIELGPVPFIGSGLIALCIAWVTVGGTAARAASEKPVLALRYE